MSSWPWLFLGVLTGLIYFLLLGWAVNRLCSGTVRGAQAWLAATGASRLLLIAALLIVAASRGATELLWAFFGFWLARWPLLYWWGQHCDPAEVQS